jgi:hypothetical protein
MSGSPGPGEFALDMNVQDGRTVVRLTGTRDAAVIVRSDSGEKIYLPPGDFTEAVGASDGSTGGAYQRVSDGPYDGGAPTDSPYDQSGPAESPYDPVDDAEGRSRAEAEGGATREPTLGVESVPDGVRIVHPEPVTDVRVIR